MMWRKSWWECRFRVLLAAFISLAFYGGFLMLALDDGKKAAAIWASYQALLSGVVVPTIAVLMAGSGINTQTSHGMLHGFHPSMYFLLSLPVSRRKALLTRAALGALFTLLFIVATVALVRIVSAARGLPIGFPNPVATVVFTAIGAAGFFGLATLLATTLDEVWAGMIGMGLVGFFVGFGEALETASKNSHLQVLRFISGQRYAQTGEVSWGMVEFFLAVGVGCLLASIYVVEKKEY